MDNYTQANSNHQQIQDILSKQQAYIKYGSPVVGSPLVGSPIVGSQLIGSMKQVDTQMVSSLNQLSPSLRFIGQAKYENLIIQLIANSNKCINHTSHLIVLNNSNRIQSPVVSQQQIIIQPSVRSVPQPNAEVHHFERPLQVVTMDDMDSKWKTKCMQLEVYLYDLQQENLRLKGSGQISYVQDETKINELMNINKELKNQEQISKQANKQLQDELDQWKLRYKQLQESNSKNSGEEQLKKKINQLSNDLEKAFQQNQFKDQEILKLKSLLNDKDNELDQLDARIRELEIQCESYSSSEQQIITLQGEVELWKRKFKQQNEINSDISEKLTMAETQLEAIKKSKVTVTKETEVKRSGVQGFESSQKTGDQTTYQQGSGRNSTIRNSGFIDRKQL